MAVLSVMAIPGDPDELANRMEQTIAPVAARRAPLYGGISSTVVRTDEGIKIFNLWQDEEGRHRMAEDPEVQAALREASFPEPHFSGYQVLAQHSATEQAKAVAQRVADEVWTQGKLELIDELLSEDFVGHDQTSGDFRGPAGFRELVQRYRSAFPDMRMEVNQIIAEGDTVVTHWTARGSNSGELMGMPATGREAAVEGVSIDRFRDGKIVESSGLFDALGMLQQLGAIPAAGAATTA